MPGINVTTAVRQGPTGNGDIVAGQWFVVGEAERGDITKPTLCRSFSDYVREYGDYQAGNLYQYVKTYFDEGGTRCYVQRVLGASHATAAKTLQDAAGSPANTMTITAKNPGKWGNTVSVEVLTSADATVAISGYFRIKLYLNDVLIFTSRDLKDVTDAINFINESRTVNHLVVASNETASTANPAALAKTALTSGANGTNAATAGEKVAGLALFTEDLKNGAVSVPGVYDNTTRDGLLAHAEAHNRIALFSFAAGTSVDTAITTASTEYVDTAASHTAYYWPHVKVPSPSATELASYAAAGATTATAEPDPASATVTICPTAYAAGARARAIQASGGPWRPGAGAISVARTVVDLNQAVSPADGDRLDEGRVNALRKIGSTIRVYGARSVSSDETNFRYITMRDTLNHIVYGVEARMEEFIFNTIDSRGNLFARIEGSIVSFLDPMRVSGGLYEARNAQGQLVDPGYVVTVDATNNPNSQLAQGTVKATVGVRVAGVVDLIEVEVTKSTLNSPVI